MGGVSSKLDRKCSAKQLSVVNRVSSWNKVQIQIIGDKIANPKYINAHIVRSIGRECESSGQSDPFEDWDTEDFRVFYAVCNIDVYNSKFPGNSVPKACLRDRMGYSRGYCIHQFNLREMAQEYFGVTFHSKKSAKIPGRNGPILVTTYNKKRKAAKKDSLKRLRDSDSPTELLIQGEGDFQRGDNIFFVTPPGKIRNRNQKQPYCDDYYDDKF